MSPRNKIVRPCVGPCSVTIKPEVDGPLSILTSSPSSVSSTAAVVIGKCRPSSGCSCIRLRNSTALGSKSLAPESHIPLFVTTTSKLKTAIEERQLKKGN